MGFNRPQIHQENLISFTEIDPTTRTRRSEFRFRINPSQLRVNKKKVEKYVLTKLGYERQFWGNDLFVFQYNGSSGAFRPDEIVDPSIGFDIMQTRAWQKFKEFERFFELQGEGTVRMRIFSDPFEYVGSLPEFSFEQDANRPFQIRYNFTFIGIPRDAVPTEIVLTPPT